MKLDRLLFFVLFLSLVAPVSAQVVGSYGYYWTYSNVQNEDTQYDASDVLQRFDYFNRLSLSVGIKSKHEVSGVFDFGVFWDFKSHQLSYQYWVGKNMSVGLIHQNMAYYVQDKSLSKAYIGGSYGYLKSRQIGLTAEIRKEVSSFAFQISPQVLFGGSRKSEEFSDLLQSNTNKRSLRTETFRLDNMLSVKLEGSIAWQVFHIKNTAFKLKYTSGVKHDWFAFENHSVFYEWTKSNALIDEKYKVRHTMIQFQNEISLVLTIN